VPRRALLPEPGERLLALLDRSRSEPPGAPPPRFLRAVAETPAYARVLPVVVSRLRESGTLGTLDPLERAWAEVSHAWAVARTDAIAKDLARVAAACGAAGVRAFLVKGTALHGLLYADPAARPSGDVDLFVSGREVPALHERLLAEGFAPALDVEERVRAHERSGGRHPWLADLGYRAPDARTVVEVKADPVGIGLPPRRIDEFGEGGAPSPRYPGLWIPSAEVMLLQLACAAARRAEFDLLALSEIAGVARARRDSLDPNRVLALVRGDGLDGIVRAMFERAERWFPGSAPRALLRRRGRPAGWVPRSLRSARDSVSARPNAPAVWAAQALRCRRPAAFAIWLVRRAFPPQPLLSRQASDRSAAPLLRGMRRLLSLRAP
jgi:hypothetical protein